MDNIKNDQYYINNILKNLDFIIGNMSGIDLQKILSVTGFNCRIKGDHFIYYKAGIEEIINIQPDGNKAKPYQVKQVRNLLAKYKLEVY